MKLISRLLIRLATIGNVSLIVWIVLELLRIPLYFIPGNGGPSTFVTYLFALILIGVVANIGTVILVGLSLIKGSKIENIGLAKLNIFFFLMVLLYYGFAPSFA